MDLILGDNSRQDFAAAIRNIYPGVPDDIVNNVIQIAEEFSPMDSFENKLGIMVNLLSEYGAWGPQPSATNDTSFNHYYNNIMELFPDANPDYILQFCRDQPSEFNLEDVVQKLCTGKDLSICYKIYLLIYLNFRRL